MNEDFYNKHYIITLADGAITDAWSDGPHPEKDTAGAVCVNKKGGYQFRMLVTFFTDAHGVPWHQRTEENPPIYTMDGIPLYKWDGSQVVPRTEAEMEADRAAIPEPPPCPVMRLLPCRGQGCPGNTRHYPFVRRS